ncbi:Hsp33 family molecular chaperone HslO [Paracoccaceae bacterium]|nr:Hsp33 family molecular chaperone HslO [Paracoccaceae bacterium]
MKKKFVDSILPFQIDSKNLRGRFARVEKVTSDILKNHHFPDEVCALLIEAILLTILIGEMIKIRWKLSLQIRGSGGSIKLLATDYYAPREVGKPARVRAYADYDKDAKHLNLESGLFAITIDQGKKMEPYQGITPIIEGSLSKSAENYFFQSEQIKTFFDLNITKKHGEKNGKNWSASGFMLQALPGDDYNEMVDDESWNNLKKRIIEQTKDYLMSADFDQYRFLDKIFQTSTLTVFKETTLKFGCSCKQKTLLNTLAKYPKDQLEEMSDNQKKISADCQFCGKQFQFFIQEILDYHES